MEKNGLPYQNYLFDLYGTLVDIHTEEEDAGLWEQISRQLAGEGVAHHPRELQMDYAHEIARLERLAKGERGEFAEIDITPVFRSFYTSAGVTPRAEDVSRLAGQFRMLSLKKLRLFPGVRELLQTLRDRGCGVYLLSNAQRQFTWPEVQRLGLEPYFDGILLSSDAQVKKPSEKMYRMMLETYTLDVKTTAMVGNDDVADCHGAAAVGLDSFYVQTEQSPVRTGPLPKNCRELAHIGQLKDLVIGNKE